MILVISYEGEEHTDAVLRHLSAQGRQVVRLDMADFPAPAALSARWPADGPPSFVVDTPAGAVDLAGVDAVWWRRVQPFTVDPAIASVERRHFVSSETGQAVHGMLDSLDCPWVNPRLADAAAHHKPLQWSVARALGLRVPRTLVTTQAQAARAFVQELGLGQVVFKAFLASIEEWRETRLVEAEDLQRLDLLRYAPVIFQEYIPGVDLRITLVGEQVFAAEIDARHSSYPVDMRMVIGEGKVRAVDLPAELGERLLALQRRLGLVYGAVDMRRSDDGEYHFLEVNPAGQWLFVEERTGLPISQAHAALLADLSDQHARRRH
jgi:glutathione synthase/RimK-type ligase-like ATP-grasp enzyme